MERTCWTRWLMPVIPALWEGKVGRSRGQEIETTLANTHFGRSRQMDHLRSGVRDQPSQHAETPSLLKTQKLAGYNGLCLCSQLLRELRLGVLSPDEPFQVVAHSPNHEGDRECDIGSIEYHNGRDKSEKYCDTYLQPGMEEVCQKHPVKVNRVAGKTAPVGCPEAQRGQSRGITLKNC
ncbi:NANOG neighbor homeobox [Plecturocebus cupreus]